MKNIKRTSRRMKLKLTYLLSFAAISLSIVACQENKVEYQLVNTFSWLYNDAGSGANVDLSIWRPTDTEGQGYYALGDVGVPTHNRPSVGMMVKAIASDALVQPTGSTEIWNDRGSGGDNDLRVMQLTAPSGYVCLGNVAVGNYYSLPNYSLYRCVKQEYLTSGTYSLIWNTAGSSPNRPFSAWKVESSGSGISPYVFKSHASHANLACCPSVPDSRYFVDAINSNGDFPNCKLDAIGHGYAGNIHFTNTGQTCRNWSDMTQAQEDSFSCGSSSLLEEDYCRNCNERNGGPWCFTGTGVNDWETCNVPVCQSSAMCSNSTTGTSYVGTRGMTVSGRKCQSWSSQTPHAHSYTSASMFPDSTVADAKNHCRNPDESKHKLWCYTTDTTKEWEECDVPLCSDTEDCGKDSLQRRTTKHVLHFGIDGLHSTCWENAPGGAPNLQSLVSEGASTTTNARAELVTSSGPNWGAHLCGMGIESTGITSNSWLPPWTGNSPAITPVNGRTYPMPCAFNYLKGMDSNIRTAAFYNWEWIKYLSNTGIPGSTDVEYKPSSSYAAGDNDLTPKAAAYLKKIVDAAEKSYTFVHLDQVDGAGHSHTWCSSQYLQAVANVDSLLGQVLQAIEGKPVLVMVSSDHGGDNGHGNMRDSDILIPMWIRGPGVKTNYQIAGQVKNRDILPTAVWALGLKGSSYWDGSVMYEVFE